MLQYQNSQPTKVQILHTQNILQQTKNQESKEKETNPEERKPREARTKEIKKDKPLNITRRRRE